MPLFRSLREVRGSLIVQDNKYLTSLDFLRATQLARVNDIIIHANPNLVDARLPSNLTILSAKSSRIGENVLLCASRIPLARWVYEPALTCYNVRAHFELLVEMDTNSTEDAVLRTLQTTISAAVSPLQQPTSTPSASIQLRVASQPSCGCIPTVDGGAHSTPSPTNNTNKTVVIQGSVGRLPANSSIIQVLTGLDFAADAISAPSFTAKLRFRPVLTGDTTATPQRAVDMVLTVHSNVTTAPCCSGRPSSPLSTQRFWVCSTDRHFCLRGTTVLQVLPTSSTRLCSVLSCLQRQPLSSTTVLKC